MMNKPDFEEERQAGRIGPMEGEAPAPDDHGTMDDVTWDHSEVMELVTEKGILLPQYISEMIRKGEVIPPELLELQQKVQDFTLSFIKSILRTSYYDAEHPEAKQAKRGLYAKMLAIMEDKGQLNFLLRKGYDGDDIMLDGNFEEPISLKELMTRNMAEIFIPKFTDYFNRKALRSLSIKSTISQEQFETFIDIMGEAPAGQGKMTLDEERRAMTEALEKHHIRDVSTVFEEDIIGKRRRLPWRVELAISRLSKDLRLLPLYESSSLETMHWIKMQIFSDIFRPIRRVDVIVEILLNVDLIKQSVEHIPELTGLDVETEVIGIMRPKLLIRSAEYIAGMYRDMKTQPITRYGIEPETMQANLKSLMLKYAAYFLTEKPPGTDGFLEGLYRDGMLHFEELPEHLKDRINIERLTDRVQTELESTCRQLEHLRSAVEYEEMSQYYPAIIQELMERNDIGSLVTLHKLFEHHMKEVVQGFEERAVLAGDVLDKTWTEDNLLNLRDRLETTDKHERHEIIQIFASRGMQGLPHLYHIVKESEDKWVRKEVITAVIGIGPIAAPYLLEKLGESDLPWYTYRNLLYILNELKIEEGADMAVGFMAHVQPQVQAEAVKLLATISPDRYRQYILRALRSEHDSIKRRAIEILSRLKVTDPAFTSPLMHWLLEDTNEKNESLQVAICRALARMGNIMMPNHETSEAALHKALIKDSQTGLLAALRPLQFKKPPRLQAEIAAALGQIGTNRSKRILAKMANSRNQQVKDTSRQALQRLKNRT
ncbi:HEAT repeat domain-containing protein [bacterium]|nr:HEAT repeat domain-containing protein [candidate division CSSED10-310 bacterium]